MGDRYASRSHHLGASYGLGDRYASKSDHLDASYGLADRYASRSDHLGASYGLADHYTSAPERLTGVILRINLHQHLFQKPNPGKRSSQKADADLGIQTDKPRDILTLQR